MKSIGRIALCGMGFIGMAAAPAPTPTPSPAQSVGEKLNEVVCQKQEVLGSRLGSKRVCKTRAEWAVDQREDRQSIDKIQIERGLKE